MLPLFDALASTVLGTACRRNSGVSASARLLLRLGLGLLLGLGGGVMLPVAAAVSVTPTTNPTTLTNALQGSGVTVTNVTVTQGSATGQVGTFINGTQMSGPGAVLQIDRGVALGTGNVRQIIEGPNDDDEFSSGSAADTLYDNDLGNLSGAPSACGASGNSLCDVVILEFDVVPTGAFLALDFQFGSEEYNDYVCSSFNDALGLFLSGPGISGPYSNSAINLAELADGSRVAINQINVGTKGSQFEQPVIDAGDCNLGNAAFYVQNIDTTGNASVGLSDSVNATSYTNLQLDGLTTRIRALATVTPGQTYHFKIVLADLIDRDLDSAAMIDLVSSFNLDLGDAPDSYGTTFVSQLVGPAGGARHQIVSGLQLGNVAPDGELNGAPATTGNPADGDDLAGSDDEDLMVDEIELLEGATSVSFTGLDVTNSTASVATVLAWIDFDGDGAFEVGEAATSSVPAGAGATTVNLNWTGLSPLTAGTTYARFRITTDSAISTATPGSFAADGEVEDYRVRVFPPLSLVKRAFLPSGGAIPSGAVLPRGTELHFMIYINNDNAARTDVSIQDVLNAAFVYQAASIRVDSSQPNCAATTCTPAEEGSVFAAALAAPTLSDGVDGDTASFTTDTMNVGNGSVANGRLDIPANRVWALVFTVRIQ